MWAWIAIIYIVVQLIVSEVRKENARQYADRVSRERNKRT